LKHFWEHIVEKTKTNFVTFFPKVVLCISLVLQESWQTHGGKRNGEESKHNMALHKWHLHEKQ
jgi:hypothetical protein